MTVATETEPLESMPDDPPDAPAESAAPRESAAPAVDAPTVAAPAVDAPSGPRLFRALTATAIVLALLLVTGLAWIVLHDESGKPAGMAVSVEIPADSSSAQIARILADDGVVANAMAFRIVARLTGSDARLKPGVYELTTGMSYTQVAELLTKGPDVVFFELQVPEGWTVAQIAARVAARTDVAESDFLAVATTQGQDPDLVAKFPFLKSNRTPSLEGYLFPKTYQVEAGSSARQIIEMMLAQFGRETAGLDLTVPRGHSLTLHDVVTTASMIEREARVPGERPVIASVIYNRLAQDMPLEIDATVLYVVGYKTRLLNRDLRVDSPYNTYIVHGLPPGPIASPGLASLEAACHPADTQFYYYVRTGKDGSHTFTRTKAEFLTVKAQAKKGLK